jgi:ABC-type uncharacterized transport system substrate-binding protein
MAPDNPARERLAGVTTDISPFDQIKWIKRTASRATHIGVLHSSSTRQTVEAIRSAGKKNAIAIVAIEASKEEFPEAVDKLSVQQCDGVLMIPDARVYNSATVQRLLLWGIRSKKPVWTFSPNIVKAGAFAAQYSDARAIGWQTAEVVKQVLAGTRVSKIGLQYVQDVKHAANARTAGILGLPISSQIEKDLSVLYGKE